MKILQVCDIFSPQTNGTRLLVSQLCKVLSGRGHKVTLICRADHVDTDYIKSFDGVEIIPFHVAARPLGFPIIPDMRRWAARHLSEFDIVHQHSFRTYANSIMRPTVPYILDCHGSFSRLGKKTFKWAYDQVIGNDVMRQAAKVVAETEANISEYVKGGIPRDKIVLLAPPPCDVTEFETLPTKGLFRARYNLGNTKDSHVPWADSLGEGLGFPCRFVCSTNKITERCGTCNRRKR